MIETVVKWFNTTRGFGFALCPDGGTDIFLHYKKIQSEGFRNLVEGERIRIDEVQDTPKGRAAVSVVSLESVAP